MRATSGRVSHEWQAGAWTWGISCWLPVSCSRGITTQRLPWWWRPWAWTLCPSLSIIRCSLCTVSRWSQPFGAGCWKPIMRITLIGWWIVLLVSCNDNIIVDSFLAWCQCLLQYYDRTKIVCTVSLFICHLKRWLLQLIDMVYVWSVPSIPKPCPFGIDRSLAGTYTFLSYPIFWDYL